MRTNGLLVVGLVTVLAGTARAERGAPEERLVEHGTINVRSGPGQQFYVTDRLSPGTKVEVHRQENGWLAIRPPETSFSWVRRSQLQMTDEPGVAKVAEDGALCRIGSRVAITHDQVCQVKLRKGELVEVLEERPSGDAPEEGAEEIWCRISPPAGEFRWVWADDLALPTITKPPPPSSVPPLTLPPAVVAPRTSSTAAAAAPAMASPPIALPPPPLLEPPPKVETPQPPETWQPRKPGPAEISGPRVGISADPALRSAATEAAAGGREPQVPRPAEPAPRPETSTTPSSVPPAVTEEPTPVTSAAPLELVRLPSETAPIQRPPPHPASTTKPAETPRPAAALEQPPAIQPLPEQPPAGPPVDSTSQWAARGRLPHEDLNQLEVELSVMVSRQIHTWRLLPLRQRAEAVLGRLGSDSEKTQAERLIQKIREFEEIENRVLEARPRSPEAAPSSGAASGGMSVSPDARYDGTGWLVPVHSATRTAPAYALLNNEGDVLQYVSPTPGLNLRRYERKQVGIYGQRASAPALNKPLLTAERIVDLDRHLLR